MNIIEAIESGKYFRRAIWDKDIRLNVIQGKCFSGEWANLFEWTYKRKIKNLNDLYPDDIIANDWETED